MVAPCRLKFSTLSWKNERVRERGKEEKEREKKERKEEKKEERDSFSSSALYDFFPSTRMRSLITHD
jgi:hypothetical protein